MADATGISSRNARQETPPCPAQSPRDLGKELGGKGRVVAIAEEGIAVLAVDRLPERGVDVVTMACFQAQAGLGHGTALALELLALVAEVKPARKSSKSQ
jgi:hypothetical protein